MKEYTLHTDGGIVNLNLPTSMDEISPEFLAEITSHITLCRGYVLVAVIYREKLAVLINSAKGNKTLTASVIPVFVKADSALDFVNSCTVGTKLVVTGANIARGIHVGVPYNSLNMDNVVALCNMDKAIYGEALKSSVYHYFVEFKIVPDYDVVASIGDAKPIADVYVTTQNTATA